MKKKINGIYRMFCMFKEPEKYKFFYIFFFDEITSRSFQKHSTAHTQSVSICRVLVIGLIGTFAIAKCINTSLTRSNVVIRERPSCTDLMSF